MRYPIDDWNDDAVTEQGAWRAVFSEAGVEEHTARDVEIICGFLDAANRLPMMPLFEIGSGVGRLTSKVQQCVKREVIGFDPAMNMVDWANLRNTNPYVRFEQGGAPIFSVYDRMFGGGYSMLTFQHLDAATIDWYFEAMSRRLLPACPFVLQFVVATEGSEEHHSAWDHRYSIDWMYKQAKSYGLTCDTFHIDERHPEWVWTTLWRGWE